MKRKRKETKLYISTKEIEELHERYAPIFKQFAIDQDCGEFYINAMVESTMTTLRREIEELSEANRLEIETKNAKINAANDEQIPAYYRPLRRLFRRTPNRAMAAILDEAEIAADETLAKIEHENDINNVSAEITIAQLLTSSELPKDENGKHLSRRKLNKLFKDPLKFLALFNIEETDEQGEEAELQKVANEQSETPATLPIRKKRRIAEQSEQLPGQIGINEINADNGE